MCMVDVPQIQAVNFFWISFFHFHELYEANPKSAHMASWVWILLVYQVIPRLKFSNLIALRGVILNNHVYTPCFLSYWNGTGAFGRWSNLVIIFNKDWNGMETDKTRNSHSPFNWKRKEGHVSTLLAVQEDRDRLEEKPDVHCWKRKKRK